MEHPLLSFLLLAAVGVAAGRAAEKARLPDITGQVLAGIALGPCALGLFSPSDLAKAAPVCDIALGVMTFIIGTHLNFARLHNAGVRIVNFALFDAVFSMAIVFAGLHYLAGTPPAVSLLAAAVAAETAPGTIISLVMGKKARGAFVSTLLGVVALANVLTILAFELAKAMAVELVAPAGGVSALSHLAAPASYMLADIAAGVACGAALSLLTKHMHKRQEIFTLAFLALLALVTLCGSNKNMSSLTACLAMGAAFGNMSYHTKDLLKDFGNITPLVFAVFFTVAGTHLDLGLLKAAGLAGVVYIVLRIAAKMLSTTAAGRIFSYPPKISGCLGLALIPQAGLAIGLVISLGENQVLSQSQTAAILTTIVLASVAVNEIIGPVAAARSLDITGETGQAGARLVDFLQEEFILTPMKSVEKWDAIRELSGFLIKTNRLRKVTPESFLESVLEREKEYSTGIGNRIAVPHAILPPGENPVGVIGVAKTPIDFESQDGLKVDIIVLFATPKGREHLHLKILAAVSKIFGNDSETHDKVAAAANAAEAYDILQSKEVRDINHFLEEDA